MFLEWGFALGLLLLIVVAAVCMGIGSKLREGYPENRAGILIGSVFFAIGLVGLSIAAFAIVANFVAPIGRAAYCLMAECGEAATATAQVRSFKCQQQPLPEFTLGETSNPTDEQVEQLCQCIWDKLGTWEKRVAAAIAKDEEPTGPLPSASLNIRAFMSRFSEAMSNCGGYDL